MSADLSDLVRRHLARRCANAGRHQGWTLREGQGGGSRVSAATWDGDGTPDIAAGRSRKWRSIGQSPLFMLRPQGDGGPRCDSLEAEAGYTRSMDPVTLYEITSPRGRSCRNRLRRSPAFETWPPLAIQTELWAAGGIGPARLAIMERVRPAPRQPHCLAVSRDKPAGCGLCRHDGHHIAAMLHALESYSRRFAAEGLGTAS